MIHAVVYAILLSLYIVPPCTEIYHLDVIANRDLAGTVTVHRDQDVILAGFSGTDSRQRFEIERSPGRAHIFLVYPPDLPGPWTFDLAEPLSRLRPAGQHPDQTFASGPPEPLPSDGTGPTGPRVTWRLQAHPEVRYLWSPDIDMVFVLRYGVR